jgi:CBS domain-containing protein
MKAKDIMTKEVISLSPEMMASDALDFLQRRAISGLPVLNTDKKLVGMFTEKEVIAAILPSYVEKVGTFAYAGNSKAINSKIHAFNSMKVKDVMRKDVVTVDEDASIYEIVRIMLTQKIRRLAVLNKVKDVVGLIARGDVVRALFREQLYGYKQ